MTTSKIHAIQTRTVRVTDCRRVGQGRGSTRQVIILLDRPRTEPLPIYAWAIETNEGVVLVDTGETSTTGPHRLR
jgi:N-acyl homoserine lactone hydrolase